MKIVFVYWGFENAGSMLDLRGYARAGKALGHEVLVYGPPNTKLALDYSLDLESADAVIFVFEWTTQLQYGDGMDWLRLLESVPRNRRLVIDCDGAYNDKIEHHGDYNHKTDEASRAWVEVCDSLTDKIFQPSPRPQRANVRPFLFHIYDPTWESPLNFKNKEFSMMYVGHTKFRWHGMSQVLKAIEKVRDRVGRVALVGEGWDSPIEWQEWLDIKQDYHVDRDYLDKNRFETFQPVPFAQVTATMNKGVFNPVIYRPLFEKLDFVTCRTFETPAAGTIPLFLLDQRYVAEVYGERALELTFGDSDRSEKILDVLARPEHYAGIVMDIRKVFAEKHSPESRLKRLVELIEE